MNTKVQSSKVLFFLLATGMQTAIVMPQAGAQDGRRIAIVVGNDEYRPQQGLENLHQAINDARSLSSALRSIGFTQVILTTDRLWYSTSLVATSG